MPTIQVQKIRTFEGHSQPIYNLSPSTRPGHFLSCGSEGIVAEWNIATGKARAIVQAQSPIFSMRLHSSRQLLVLGMQSGEVVFADLASSKPLRRFQLHQGAVFDAVPLPDGKHLLISSQDGTVSIWNLNKMDHVHRQAISPKSVRSLALSPDGKSLAAGSSDNKIRIFDLGLNLQQEWTAHKLSVFRLVYSPDGKLLFSTGRDASISQWEVDAAYKMRHSVPAHMYAVNDLIFVEDHPWLLSGSMDKSIKIWAPDTLELHKVINFEKHQCHWNGVNRLLWLENHLFSCSDDRQIMQWKLH